MYYNGIINLLKTPFVNNLLNIGIIQSGSESITTKIYSILVPLWEISFDSVNHRL